MLARTALDRGMAAERAGERNSAIRWFDRVVRLARADPHARLMLASALAGQDAARAQAILAALSVELPHLFAPKAMQAAICMQQHDMSGAQDRVALLLSTMAVPPDPSFRRLAESITKHSALPGWMSVDCRGCVAWWCRTPGRVTLALDGKRVYSAEPERTSWTLSPQWHGATFLTAHVAGVPLLGSPVALATRRAAMGFVEILDSGDMVGWAMMLADPSANPDLVIVDRDTGLRQAIGDSCFHDDLAAGMPGAHGFCVPAGSLPPGCHLHVVGPSGLDLLGSPLVTQVEKLAASRAAGVIKECRPARRAATPDMWRPLPVFAQPSTHQDRQGARSPRMRRPQGLDIVVPVYDHFEDLLACLQTILPARGKDVRIVVIDDSPPGTPTRAALSGLAVKGLVVLHQRRNMGFPSAVNAGLRHAAADPDRKRDVILLNPDTRATPGWVSRLAKAAYSAPDIGSVTPMTGDGTLTSYPKHGMQRSAEAILPDWLDIFAAMTDRDPVEIPTAVGFCMYIRHDCLAATGLFRDDVFAQGYGEENDWCLRARHLGWRHVTDISTFVAHAGGRSFGPAGAALRARNLRVLNRLHPGYDGAIAAFITADPLAAARRQLDTLRWRRGAMPGGAVILITHDQGGGVARHVHDRAAAFRAQGIRPIVIQAADTQVLGETARPCTLHDGDAPFAELTFDAASGLAPLAAFLRPDRPRFVELHHLMGHDHAIASLAGAMDLPLDIYIHDYAMACPRVTLRGRAGVYCGEPEDVRDCQDCVDDLGNRTGEAVPVRLLRDRSAALMAGARQIVLATREAARRLSRYAPHAAMTVRAWEDDAALIRQVRRRPVAPGATMRVCVAGSIGEDKGFSILLACARDAARRDLPLFFTVVGGTIDDDRLMQTGRVFVTGRYEEDEAETLIRAQDAQFGFLPSVWPETWCYTLSALWRAGLPVAAFDLGAQAERIRATGAGLVMPLSLPAARINDLLLAAGAKE